MSSLSINGISGVYIYANDPKSLSKWYAKNFGLRFDYWKKERSYGTEFICKDHKKSARREGTVFAIHPAPKSSTSNGFEFKVQFRVGNLEQFAEQLRGRGVQVEDLATYDYGRYARVKDPENNLVEFYEPL